MDAKTKVMYAENSACNIGCRMTATTDGKGVVTMKTTKKIIRVASLLMAVMMLLFFESCGSKISHKTITVGTEPCPESDFTFELNDDGNSVSITSYMGSREDLVFPNTIQGLPVTKIKSADGEFTKDGQYTSEIVTSVYIPEGIEEIGDEAFKAFGYLNKIVMKGVTKIGKNAFSGVGNSYYEENGKIIYESRFEWNNKTKNWDFSNKGYKFSVDSYPTIEFSPTLKIIGYCAFFNSGFRSIKLPEGLVAIDSGAFQRSKFDNIDFPSSLKVIGAYAFNESKLKEVRLNEGLEFLGRSAFYNCNELTSISLPSSLKYVTHYGECEIFKGDMISEINIPDNFNPVIVPFAEDDAAFGSGRDSWNPKTQKLSKLFIIPESTLQSSLQLQRTLNKEILYATYSEVDKARDTYYLYARGEK